MCKINNFNHFHPMTHIEKHKRYHNHCVLFLYLNRCHPSSTLLLCSTSNIHHYLLRPLKSLISLTNTFVTNESIFISFNTFVRRQLRKPFRLIYMPFRNIDHSKSILHAIRCICFIAIFPQHTGGVPRIY